MRRRLTGRARLACGAVAVSAVAAAVVALVLPLPASGTVTSGTTWYSDGTNTKAGPPGTQIKVYATGALQNVAYTLVLGDLGTEPGHSNSACFRTLAVLNPTVLRVGQNGLIGTVTGTVSFAAPGTYQVCFKDSVSGSTATAGTSFTVL